MWRSEIELAWLRHRRARIMDSSQNLIQAPLDEPITSMDPETYKVVIKGKRLEFQRIVDGENVCVLNEVTPSRNTILHLASFHGYNHLVKDILDHERNVLNSAPSSSSYQTLLMRPNSKGNLALHMAAAAGHVLVVNHLIESLRQVSQGAREAVFRTTNNDGDTALHLALKGNHAAVALSLVHADISTSFILNIESVSPLYLAANAGNAALVKKMLRDWDASLPGKSVVHAAIRSKNLDTLEAVLAKNSDLVITFGGDGKTPLSYAASIEFDSGVEYLLKKYGCSIQVAYVKDQDGSFPVHSACRAGQTSALQMILHHHPDAVELINTHGQNILHVAAESGKAKTVDLLLRKPDIEKLINEKDSKGNTPLQLAGINWHPKVVSLLVQDDRVNLNALNNENFTALDAVEEHLAPVPSLQQWLTWVALVSAGATRAFQVHLREDVPGSMTHEEFKLKIYKNRVNTLLLVATLVATMSFAAGLSVPLGYNSTDFKSNTKNPYEDSAFHAFVICNSIAVYGAVISMVALIGAQLADLNCIVSMFRAVVPLLSFAIIAMSLAFLAGLYLVLGQHHWLAIFVMASGGFYLVALLLLIIPFVSPYTLSPLLFRYVLRYPFSMLTSFIEWKDGTGDYEEHEPPSALSNPR